MSTYRLPTCSEPTTISRKATIAGLTLLGWFEYEKGREFRQPSIRYRMFSKTDAGCQYLVGKSGALRKVNTGDSISDSVSLTGDKFHAALCELSRFSRMESIAEAERVFNEILNGKPYTPA